MMYGFLLIFSQNLLADSKNIAANLEWIGDIPSDCKSEVFCSEIEKLSYGIAYPAINESVLVNIKMVLPPPEEQNTIASFLMKVYKKFLIYEYVTGKKRVKG
jgi:hypothetical protein